MVHAVADVLGVSCFRVWQIWGDVGLSPGDRQERGAHQHLRCDQQYLGINLAGDRLCVSGLRGRAGSEAKTGNSSVSRGEACQRSFSRASVQSVR